MPADNASSAAAKSPQTTKGRCGPVNTLSNNTSALTEGDPARARATHRKADAALGIAWWNAMSERARLAALKAVEPEGGASPAEAWAHWKETAGGFKCEEAVHG
jgi:hypothetical protein